MKHLIVVILLLFYSAISFAQCDKKIKLSSSKTEFIDTSGNVQDSKDENTIIEISKTSLTITPGEEDHTMTGTIKSSTCNWKIPFKEGKMIIKAVLDDEHGETKNLTITIEGKDGKLTFLGEIEEMPDRKVRLMIDKFEEKE